MEGLVDRLRMRHAVDHCKSDRTDGAHVRERPAYIMPIAQQLSRVRHPVRAVEEVVYPMGGVGQERLGLNFVPSIFGYDSKDERMSMSW